MSKRKGAPSEEADKDHHHHGVVSTDDDNPDLPVLFDCSTLSGDDDENNNVPAAASSTTTAAEQTDAEGEPPQPTAAAASAIPVPKKPSNARGATLPKAPQVLFINGKLHDLVQLLGRGSFGSCYHYRKPSSRPNDADRPGAGVAVKLMLRSSCSQYEMRLHRRMVHPNIVRWLHGMQNRSTYFLVMEKCWSSMAEQLRCDLSPMPVLRIRRLFAGALAGLAYIHRAGYVHRDIKMGNLLLSDYHTLKICDFGLATVCNTAVQSLCGTWSFLAPEMLTQRCRVQSALDIWALGVCMYLCQSRGHPFATGERLETIRRICLAVYERPLEARRSIGGAMLLRLLGRMFERNPERRPTAEQVLEDAFFAGDASKFEMNVEKPPVEYHFNLDIQRVRAVQLLQRYLDHKRARSDGDAVTTTTTTSSVRALNFRPVWVCCSCSYDAQQPYRLRYNLSNGAIGAFFADSTTLMRTASDRMLHFDKHGDFMTNLLKQHDDFFAAVRHQMLTFYGTTVHDGGDVTAQLQTHRDEIVYVEGFMHTTNARVFMLSNRSVQVNTATQCFLFGAHITTRKIVCDTGASKVGTAVEIGDEDLDETVWEHLERIVQQLTRAV